MLLKDNFIIYNNTGNIHMHVLVYIKLKCKRMGFAHYSKKDLFDP